MIKKISFLLICALVIVSCGNEQVTGLDITDPGLSDPVLSEPKEPVVTDPIVTESSFSIMSAAVRLNEKDGVFEFDTLFWSSGSDILWYNGTTGEIKFTDNTPGVPFTFYSSLDYAQNHLIIYFNDEELFSLVYLNHIMSFGSFFPCMMLESRYEREGYYIPTYFYRIFKYGFPKVEFDAAMEENLKANNYLELLSLFYERENYLKSIEPGWNKFIEQLKKEGRYRE